MTPSDRQLIDKLHEDVKRMKNRERALRQELRNARLFIHSALFGRWTTFTPSDVTHQIARIDKVLKRRKG